ncbi:MAG: heterodisulfide reductase-related iron-sulfur binding cluster [Acidimicrobiia bacterium]|nr:MAG: heterodisulfide reductase-related iron-sulfur binding cluster [Acidimicrobiia bacterium]
MATPVIFAAESLGETAGRETFLGFPGWAIGIFYLATVIAIGLFLWGFYRRIRKYSRGRPTARLDFKRFVRALGDLSSNRTIAKRKPAVGIAHFFVFWGFIVLLIGTTIIAIDVDIIGVLARKPEWQFWEGPFYVVYAFVLDVFGIGFVAGLITLAVIRRKKPARLDYSRVDGVEADRSGYSLDDKAFMLILLALGISGFLLEGFRIAATNYPDFEIVSIGGWVIAQLTSPLGESGNDVARVVTWWFHGAAALAFVAYLPYSKGMHVIDDAANLAFTEPRSAAVLAGVENPTAPGYSSLDDFTWKDLLDLDACTKCGRCHEVCPATASGAPLSPRDLILDLREHADARAGIKLWYGHGATPGHPNETEVAGAVIQSSTLWACTTCMACMEACPVGIEHIPTIVQLRRRLVDSGDVEPGLQNAFQALARAGNSFGKSAKQRARWTKGLEFKLKDARKEPVDYLWFVGDHGSFDPRATEVSQAVARLMTEAGVDFGILYDGEKSAGNDVRRAGEEGLFEMLRDQNVEALESAHYQRMFTTDPHSLNTLRGEYPTDEDVLHYTALLDAFVASGKLELGGLEGKATYHDPCYLGRYQDEYDAPRRLIEATGLEVVEMGRCRENSFCCGAGGGRIWMDDSELAERPAENRIREAVALGTDIDYFVVSCPKDMIMYSDAVKTTGNEGNIAVVDIAQLVERAMEVVPVG